MCVSRSERFLRALYRIQMTEGYPKLERIARNLEWSPVVVAAIARDLLRAGFVEHMADAADAQLGITLRGRMHIGAPLTD